MKFIYAPQRSSNSRTQYYFDLESQRLVVTYMRGEEVSERKSGEYIDTFKVQEETRYDIELRSLENKLPEMPVSFIVECFTDTDAIVNLKLLKHYGAEEKNDFSITFPSWNNVLSSGHDYEIKKTSSFTEFEELIAVWRIQLSEILAQTYNVCVHLDVEYKRLGDRSRPCGSPISIRQFKTSMLQNTILYVEAVANFLISIAIAVNAQLEGTPPKKITLSESEIAKLMETKKYSALEEKLAYAVEKINDILGTTSKIDKSDSSWATFKSLKKTRDALTHVKIKNLSQYIELTLDSMLSSVRILDKDLLDCVGTIYWINSFMDDYLDSIVVKKSSSAHSFNDLIVSSLFALTSSISGFSMKEVLSKYRIKQGGIFTFDN